jgi:hypothetical protein
MCLYLKLDNPRSCSRSKFADQPHTAFILERYFTAFKNGTASLPISANTTVESRSFDQCYSTHGQLFPAASELWAMLIR